MKKCNKCGLGKELTEFNKDNSTPDKYHYKCRKCMSIYSKKDWIVNKEKIIIRNTESNYNTKLDKLNKLPLETVKQAFQVSTSFRKVSKKIFPNDVTFISQGRQVLEEYAEKHNIDFSHFTNLGFIDCSWENRENVFIKDSKRHRGILKRLLLENKVIENKCATCGMPPEWQGKLLVLRLDHINGDTKDNGIENLQLVCPNCDSQSEHYCRKKKKIKGG